MILLRHSSHSFRYLNTTAIFLVLFVAGGCKTPPPVQQVINPCGSVMSVNHDTHSFAAILLALERRQWIIEHIDQGEKSVLAGACVIGSTDCAKVIFSVDNAQVIVREPEQFPNDPRMRRDIERWLGFLKPVYSKYSCYTDDALRAEVEKYGVSF